jgi:putative membrane protein
MKKIFLTGVLSSLALFGLNGCGSDNNRTNIVSPNANQNSQQMNASNTNISNNSTVSSKTPEGDNEFMMKAAQGGMAEVELGKLASEKATNAEAKKFGQMMVEDHSNANTELKALAAKKSVTLPTDVGSEHKATMDKLKTLSGAEFDKAYVEAMVKDHEKDVSEFEKQSTDAKDADVKAFAAKTLPTLKKHLEKIKEIQSKMK